MEQAPARFAIIALGVFATAMILSLAAYPLALQFPGKRAIGLCHVVNEHIRLARQAPSPKMLVLGGSGTTQGINTQALGQALGIRAQNFGLHGAYEPSFDFFQAIKVLRPGDTVLLTLEYSAYAMDGPNGVGLDVMAHCGRDYMTRYGTVDLLRIAAAFPAEALFDRIMLAARPERPTNLPRYTEWGDLPPGYYPSPTQSERERAMGYRPLQIGLQPESAGVRDIAEFVAWARRNHVSVMATWPNVMAFDAYRTMPGFADIRRFYEGLGVPVIGTPDVAMLAPEYIRDTQYHLTEAGIHLRTRRLAEALAGRPELLASLRQQ